MKPFEIEQLRAIQANFLSSLAATNKSSDNDLSHISHTISQEPLVKDGERFQAIVIGGTYYKSALYEKQGNAICLYESDEGSQPVFTDEETLLSFITKLINPSVTQLALNLAFPLTPQRRNNQLDGTLIRGTKEHEMKGLVGKVVGKTLEAYVKAKLGRDIPVSVANDTICLILSGQTYLHDRLGLAGGIIGTGTNFAYFETSSIAVNLEAANFSHFPMFPELKTVDASSINPNTALFEKATSGAYLYKLYNEHVQRLGESIPLLSGSEKIDALADSSSRDHSSQTARIILTNSAMLCACAMSAIATHMKRDMVFVMEGSVFWKAWRYQDTVNRFTRLLAPQYNVSSIRISESNIMGAAKLIA